MAAHKFVFCTPSLKPEYGGPAYSVPRRCYHLRQAGVDVCVYTKQYDKGLSDYCDMSQVITHIDVGEYSLVHNFGLWSSFNHRISSQCRRKNVPMIVSPLGMLEPWAVNNKRLKKKLGWFFFQKKDISGAAALHATAQEEADNLVKLGISRPIAVIPHGIDLPKYLPEKKRKSEVRKILFLSRINKKKGLLTLVEAWKKVSPSGWKIIIAGPDEGGYQAVVQEKVDAYNLGEHFEFLGPVYGRDKCSLFCQADLFVLPTFSENFGLVVPEALSYGIPVITTKGAPWSDLEETNSGWWIDFGVDPLANTIDKAIRLSDRERVDMGLNGRALVESKYSWSKSAEKTLRLYEWILGEADQPDFVINA